MNDGDHRPAMPGLDELKGRLARAAADLEAGHTVSLDEALSELTVGILDAERQRNSRVTDAA